MQPEKQVPPEMSQFHLMPEILICGGYNPDINAYNAVAADAHDLFFLKNAQQPKLEPR